LCLTILSGGKAMVKRLILLMVLLLVSIPAFAETVDTAWVRRYNGPADTADEAYAIAVDDSGNVYVTGVGDGTGTSSDYATIKYHSNGDTAWVRRYNGPGNSYDGALDMAVDDSGNVYVSGNSWGSGTNSDYATIKYYSTGDTAWVRRYNGPGNAADVAYAIAVDDSGNVYVSGGSWGSGTSTDYTTIKYNSNGDTAWVRRYNGPGNAYDGASDMAIDDSGNVYVTGKSFGSGTDYDFATIKYKPDADTAWVRRYNGPADSTDGANAIAVDDSGNVYVSGYSWGNGTSADYTTIKYHPNGDTAWLRRYDGPANGDDRVSAIAVDDSGNVYVTGYSDSTGSSQDYATIKYDSSGNELWVKRFNCANGTDKPAAIAVDGSNNIYVTGRSGCGGVTAFDYVTIKYYPNGDTAWLRKYQGPVEQGYDYAYALALDSAGNAYVTGSSQGSGTDYDFCTIKYAQTTDVKEETGNKQKPSDFALSQNYPNPFNLLTTIPFHISCKGQGASCKTPIHTALAIYNIRGQRVRTLINENKLPGEYQVIWDGKDDGGKDVASGVYFYQLRVGNFSEPKKMLLLK
jgi:hypothetical protein